MSLALLLLSCIAAIPEVFEPYVRLDGETYDSFDLAFQDARSGSTIEFCGTRVGPFVRTESVDELSIEGCDRDAAVLDGNDVGTILTLPVNVLSLTAMTLTRGRASTEWVYVPGGGEDGEETHDLLYHPAVAGRVQERLQLRSVRLSESSSAADNSKSVHVVMATTEFADGQVTVEGEDGIIEGNFVHSGDSFPAACVFYAEEAGSNLHLRNFDWGPADDGSAEGRYDVCGTTGDGGFGEWDLTGKTDVDCTYEDGCHFDGDG